IEPFFSNTCTHIITTRPFVQPNAAKPGLQPCDENAYPRLIPQLPNDGMAGIKENMIAGASRIPSSSRIPLKTVNGIPKVPCQNPSSLVGGNGLVHVPAKETKDFKQKSVVEKAFELNMKVWSLESTYRFL